MFFFAYACGNLQYLLDHQIHRHNKLSDFCQNAHLCDLAGPIDLCEILSL